MSPPGRSSGPLLPRVQITENREYVDGQARRKDHLLARVARKAAPVRVSAQLRVFAFGLLKTRDAGIGILPQFEEILVCFSGFRRVARECGAARHTEIRERVELSP